MPGKRNSYQMYQHPSLRMQSDIVGSSGTRENGHKGKGNFNQTAAGVDAAEIQGDNVREPA
jgi:hypothetical protein